MTRRSIELSPKTPRYLDQLPAARRALSDMAKKDKDDKGNVIVLKTPKGTRDYAGAEMALRERMFRAIVRVFRSVEASAWIARALYRTVIFFRSLRLVANS